MNKKIKTYIFVIIIVLVLIAVGYYFSYQKPEQSQGPEQSQLPQVNIGNVIDGTFQKTENNLIYFYPKDKEEIETIELTTETAFSEITLSASLEIINEQGIDLADLQEGDSISMVVVSGERMAILIKRMVVLLPANSQNELPEINTETIIEDGTFQKTENNLIYFYPKDKEEIETIELTTEIVFSEVIFSADLELVSEKEISLTDFQEGDSISISFSEEKIVTWIKRMVVEE